MTMNIDAHAMAGSHCLAPSCRREPTLRRFTMLCNWLSRNRIAVVGFTFFSTILILGGLVVAAEPDAGVDEKAKEDTYPLTTCIVSGQQLGSMGEPVDYVYDNHLVRFCCGGCIKAFEKEPDRYMAILNKAREVQAAERSPKPYPLDTCLVSGGKLGSMGEPVTHVYTGQELQFCCRGCIPRFEKDPEKYMEKLHSMEMDQAEKPHQSKGSGGDKQ